MRQLALGCAFCALSLAASASAGERGWYVGIEGGVEFDGGSETDSGWAGILTVGAPISSHISLEGEVGYRSTSSDGWWSLGADVSQLSVMANAVYEAPISKEVSLMLGIGIGGDQVSLDYYWSNFSKSEMEVAAQVKLGVSIAVSESAELVANYRYMEHITSSPIGNSTLTVGIRFAL